MEVIDGAREGFEFCRTLSGDVNNLLWLTISACHGSTRVWIRTRWLVRCTTPELLFNLIGVALGRELEVDNEKEVLMGEL